MSQGDFRGVKAANWVRFAYFRRLSLVSGLSLVEDELCLFCMNRDSWPVTRDRCGEVVGEVVDSRLGLFCIFG